MAFDGAPVQFPSAPMNQPEFMNVGCHARVAGPFAPQQKLEHSGVQYGTIATMDHVTMSQTTALCSPGFVMELTTGYGTRFETGCNRFSDQKLVVHPGSLIGWFATHIMTTFQRIVQSFMSFPICLE